MEKNTVMFVGMISSLFVGAFLIASFVSAHMYDEEFGLEDSDLSEHYRDMMELHKQYFNSEISYEEFVGMMEDLEVPYDHPCSAGIGMMGHGMMGW